MTTDGAYAPDRNPTPAHATHVGRRVSGLARYCDLPGADPDLSLDRCDVSDRVKAAVRNAAYDRVPLELVGPPGCAATMIARRIPAYLPPLTEAEAGDVAAIRAGLTAGARWPGLGVVAGGIRPFRAPHFTCSERAMRQELALARAGVLFLDDLGEWGRLNLAHVTHALERGEGPLMLVLAARTCPCGFFSFFVARANGTNVSCACPPGARERYLARTRAFEASLVNLRAVRLDWERSL